MPQTPRPWSPLLVIDSGRAGDDLVGRQIREDRGTGEIVYAFENIAITNNGLTLQPVVDGVEIDNSLDFSFNGGFTGRNGNSFESFYFGEDAEDSYVWIERDANGNYLRTGIYDRNGFYEDTYDNNGTYQSTDVAAVDLGTSTSIFALATTAAGSSIVNISSYRETNDTASAGSVINYGSSVTLDNIEAERINNNDSWVVFDADFSGTTSDGLRGWNVDMSFSGAYVGRTAIDFTAINAQAGVQRDPSVTTLANGNVVLAWESLERSGTGIQATSETKIQFQIFNQSGTALTPITTVATETGDILSFDNVANVSVTGVGAGFALAWESVTGTIQGGLQDTARMQLFDSGGLAVGDEVVVGGGGLNGALGQISDVNIRGLSDGRIAMGFTASAPEVQNGQTVVIDTAYVQIFDPRDDHDYNDRGDLIGTPDADFFGIFNQVFFWTDNDAYLAGGDDSFRIDLSALSSGNSPIGTVADGGEGTDTLFIRDFNYLQGRVDLQNGVVSIFDDLQGGSGTAEIFNFENVTVTDSDGATVFGSDTDNVLIGGSGSDQLRGNGGNDDIQGGDGGDILNGGDGNDTIDGQSGADIINAGAGNDTVYADQDDQFLQGGDGTDTLDFERATAGVSVALGGAGFETIRDSDFDDTIDLSGNTANAAVFLSGGQDTVIGSDDGNDVIYASDYADTLSGGTSTGDILIYATSNAGVIVNLDRDSATGGSATGDTISDFESVFASYFDDIITGNGESNALLGLDGDDRLVGLGGNDTISGGEGNDDIFGGDGADTLSGGDGRDNIHADQTDTVGSGDGFDRLYLASSTASATVDLEATGFEWAAGSAFGDVLDATNMAVGVTLLGLNGNDTLTGGAFNDFIRGGNGNDTINAGDGANQVLGEAGDDTITGGAGNDRLYGGADNDTINGGDGRDLIDGGAGTDSLRGGAGGDTLVAGGGADQVDAGSGNDRVNGEGGDDTIYGGAGRDVIQGGDGNDTIFGDTPLWYVPSANESDVISGGAGNDVIYGGLGNDRINGGDDDDTISGDAGRDVLQGGAGEDTLDGNAGNDLLSGGADDDTLYGGEGNDRLNGDGGNDTLWTSEGTDLLRGGTGRDTFVLSGEAGVDVITDFQDGLDRIDVSELSVQAAGTDGLDNVTIVQNGLNVFITAGGETIRVDNADIADFTADDFVFSVI